MPAEDGLALRPQRAQQLQEKGLSSRNGVWIVAFYSQLPENEKCNTEYSRPWITDLQGQSIIGLGGPSSPAGPSDCHSRISCSPMRAAPRRPAPMTLCRQGLCASTPLLSPLKQSWGKVEPAVLVPEGTTEQ